MKFKRFEWNCPNLGLEKTIPSPLISCWPSGPIEALANSIDFHYSEALPKNLTVAMLIDVRPRGLQGFKWIMGEKWMTNKIQDHLLNSHVSCNNCWTVSRSNRSTYTVETVLKWHHSLSCLRKALVKSDEHGLPTWQSVGLDNQLREAPAMSGLVELDW